MKKVFVFCIGGTGERVMKSITMLMAAGMSTHGFTVVPIIVDPHLDLDEKKNLQTLIDKYVEIHQEASEDRKSPKGFFEAEMALINTLDTQTNNTNKAAGENRSYAEFLNIGSLDTKSINNFLIQTLYSKENLDNHLSVGFRGNPNVGTVVLQEMLEGASWYNAFKTHCGEEDRVFIISSIFGGTGASGYPLLERKIRNTVDSQTVSDVFMGAVTVLPYYGLTDPNKNKSKIDSANFMTKAKAALTYYERTVKSDLLYYVGETTLQAFHENNEKTQPDEVASLDLASAGSGYASLVKCIADYSILNTLLKVLPNEKYFPLKQNRGFDASFYKGSLSKVISFSESFEKWYSELSAKKRAFAPIANIDPSNMVNIIKNSVELEAKDDSYYLLEMIKNSNKGMTNNKVRNFLEYAYEAINTFTQKIK